VKASVFFLSLLGRGLLILGKIITKIADLGSTKAGLSLDFWENCMILKKISIGKKSFFGVCLISRKITEHILLESPYCSNFKFISLMNTENVTEIRNLCINLHVLLKVSKISIHCRFANFTCRYRE
jgi:hypothetical protein